MEQKYSKKKTASGIGATRKHNAPAFKSGVAHGSRASINTAIGGGNRGQIGSGS